MLPAGCAHLRPKPADDYVYVTAKQSSLRDRVAAVSNRTGDVHNGEKLKVLDHGRHFVKVQTPEGKVGWIEEKMVATQATVQDFEQLGEQNKAEPVVASAVVRDEVYLHVKPGRESARFYLIEENDKLSMLKRAIVTKAVTADAQAKVQHAIPQAIGSNAAKPGPAKVASANDAPPAPPAKEDWWLVRDAQGHTGWMLSRMMDVDAPDSLVRYAEGQRIIGAYPLATVHDEEAPGDQKDISEYVTVMGPYKPGLPYDFDQVRVFTWSMQHHRYETAFRQRNIEGYLPVTLERKKDPYGKTPLAQEVLPAFTYRVLAAGAPAVPDPATGAMKPTRVVASTYRLEGNLVRRISPPGTPPAEVAHPEPEVTKDKKGRHR